MTQQLVQIKQEHEAAAGGGGTWERQHSEVENAPYWVNAETGESTWEDPHAGADTDAKEARQLQSPMVRQLVEIRQQHEEGEAGGGAGGGAEGAQAEEDARVVAAALAAEQAAVARVIAEREAAADVKLRAEIEAEVRPRRTPAGTFALLGSPSAD
jgi:hypothetical protein